MRLEVLPVRTATLLVLVLAACGVHVALAAEGEAPPAPRPEIKRIPITIYPHNVIVVRGRMVELDKLKDYLGGLVPDAKKPGVEVIVYPDSRAQLAQVPDIVRIAKDAGYTNVTYMSPEVKKELPEQITVVVSSTGVVTVDGGAVKDEELKAHMEKKLAAEDRPKVRVLVCATRRASMKQVAVVMKACRDAGYTDVCFQLMAE